MTFEYIILYDPSIYPPVRFYKTHGFPRRILFETYCVRGEEKNSYFVLNPCIYDAQVSHQVCVFWGGTKIHVPNARHPTIEITQFSACVQRNNIIIICPYT